MNQAISRSIELLSSSEFRQREDTEGKQKQNLNKLINMNKLGYLTLDSQVGENRISPKYQIYEKSYVLGFMERKNTIRFLKNMQLNTDKCALVLTVLPDSYPDPPSELDVALTYYADQTVVTHQSLSVPKRVVDQWKQTVYLRPTSKVDVVFCWDPVQGRTGQLYKDILKQLMTKPAKKAIPTGPNISFT